MNKQNIITPFGTCRIHRPFEKNINGVANSNIGHDTCLNYPKVGFYHSLAEITQVLTFFKKGFQEDHLFYKQYLFRKEPIHTTPNNIFNDDLWINNSVLPSEGFNDIDGTTILIEVSSIDSFYHPHSGLYFQRNPNKEIDVPYSDLRDKSFYDLYKPELGVIKTKASEKDIINDLNIIREMYPSSPIIIMGHINDHFSQYSARRNLNSILYKCCSMVTGVYYYDNKPVFEEHGYAINKNGTTDINHLSDNAEIALGKELQKISKILKEYSECNF